MIDEKRITSRKYITPHALVMKSLVIALFMFLTVDVADCRNLKKNKKKNKKNKNKNEDDFNITSTDITLQPLNPSRLIPTSILKLEINKLKNNPTPVSSEGSSLFSLTPENKTDVLTFSSTNAPTFNPTDEPTSSPTVQPTTSVPTLYPTKVLSNQPSFFSSENPSTTLPTSNPTTNIPSDIPSTKNPSDTPSVYPSLVPTIISSVNPTLKASDEPSNAIYESEIIPKLLFTNDNETKKVYSINIPINKTFYSLETNNTGYSMNKSLYEEVASDEHSNAIYETEIIPKLLFSGDNETKNDYSMSIPINKTFYSLETNNTGYSMNKSVYEVVTSLNNENKETELYNVSTSDMIFDKHTIKAIVKMEEEAFTAIISGNSSIIQLHNVSYYESFLSEEKDESNETASVYNYSSNIDSNLLVLETDGEILVQETSSSTPEVIIKKTEEIVMTKKYDMGQLSNETNKYVNITSYNTLEIFNKTDITDIDLNNTSTTTSLSIETTKPFSYIDNTTTETSTTITPESIITYDDSNVTKNEENTTTTYNTDIATTIKEDSITVDKDTSITAPIELSPTSSEEQNNGVPTNNDITMKRNTAIIAAVCSFIVAIALFAGFVYAKKRRQNSSNAGTATAVVRSAQITALEAVNSDLGFNDEEVGAGDFKINNAIGAASENAIDIIAIDNIDKDLSSALEHVPPTAVAGDVNDNDDSISAVSTFELIDIFVPPGRLGVVISTINNTPVIHQIKNSSVLYDKLLVGDALVAVDDADVRTYSASKISKLISTRKDNATRKLTILRTCNPEDNIK